MCVINEKFHWVNGGLVVGEKIQGSNFRGYDNVMEK